MHYTYVILLHYVALNNDGRSVPYIAQHLNIPRSSYLLSTSKKKLVQYVTRDTSKTRNF
jgi:hypothetical protein